MMLRYTFGMLSEADAIENAVAKVLEGPLRTGDIATEGTTLIGTKAMGDAVVAAL
jgi:3-isopropylmalate dehydrogenase